MRGWRSSGSGGRRSSEKPALGHFRTPDHGWLLDREDSPWYPTVRLFRQDESRDYARVVDRPRRELLAQIIAFESQD